jgi:hypothetical protein
MSAVDQVPDGDKFTGADNDARGVLQSLKRAEDVFAAWNETARIVDDIYSRGEEGDAHFLLSHYGWRDSQLDLFWSSFEVMKPAIYARPPQPVVVPLFKDSKKLEDTTAELLERCAINVFAQANMNRVMTQMRDDLLFAGRGVMWLRYETEGGTQRICIEHKDRLDFLHEPVRYWSEVGWVAGAAWMGREDVKDRFDLTDEQMAQVQFTARRDRYSNQYSQRAIEPKAKVWEVWHRADNKVYWVTEGLDEFLDQGPPHLELSGFFPCPRPAYGTLRRRSLIPVPDWERYAIHFRKISDLTGRIYLLLDEIKMKGLIPSGTEIGDTVAQLLRSDDDKLLIPVPGAAMMNVGATGFVQWLPLDMVANAIQGLIASRTQLIQDFYQLSGISDIMRGATDADETLGAQQLKTQYGSIRVREKSTELQRCAADAVKIASEIIAEKFSSKMLQDLSQMGLPTAADVKKHIEELQKAAVQELDALGDKVREMMGQDAAQSGPQIGHPGAPPNVPRLPPPQVAQRPQQAQQPQPGQMQGPPVQRPPAPPPGAPPPQGMPQ